MKKSLLLALFAAVSLPGALFAGGAYEDPVAIRTNQRLELTGAQITRIHPLAVRPGTLVSIEGQGFGTQAGPVQIGDTVLTEVLAWEPECIFFRVPSGGLSGPVEVRVGDTYSTDLLRPAPEGSITVTWVVQMSELTRRLPGLMQTYRVRTAPRLAPPLWIKGEWLKGSENFGHASPLWDGGSRVRMMRDRRGQKWVAELVLTPEAQSSFGVKAAKFAFEDNDLETRNLGPYESDLMFLLKKDWAVSDRFTNVSSDPAFVPNNTDVDYKADTRTILLVYPPRN